MSKFFTNRENNTLFEKFEGVLEHRPDLTNFDILVGFFRSSGYFKVQPLLSNISQVRVLVGIDTDKLTADYVAKGVLFNGASAEEVEKHWQQNFVDDIQGAQYAADIEQGVSQFIKDIVSGKLQIKAHPSKKLHAKVYILRPDDFNQHNSGQTITGSSNLSASGLGTKAEANYEFNVLLSDYSDVKFATEEFEKLWAEGVTIDKDFIAQSLKNTYLRDDITSKQLYYKLLMEYFGSEIEFDPNSIGDLPATIERLQYQLDAIAQGYLMLKKHNGFFLADVVGLGKTVVALGIAREFFYRNSYPEYMSNILIVCPPAVKDNWQEMVKAFRLQTVKIITTGSLHHITEKKQGGEYDLIIIDESHSFKNYDQERYSNLEAITKSETRNGKPKKVILVSATPFNNRPQDIQNQLLLFQDGSNSSLDIHITHYFREINKQYKDIISNHNSDKQPLINLMTKLRKDVLEPITIRRTRTDLLKIDSYKTDLQQRGFKFPKVQPPKRQLYQLDAELNALYDYSLKVISDDKSSYQYSVYRLIEFMLPEHQQTYTRPEFLTQRLRKLMKTLLLKRLDSSFLAFNASLKNFVQTSEKLINMFANNKVFIAPNVNIDQYLEEGREDDLVVDLIKQQEQDKSIKILTATDFELEFLPMLKAEHKILIELQNKWQAIVDKQIDPKLELFKIELRHQILVKDRCPQRKLVVFSESKVTTNYLRDQLQTDYKVLAIDASNRKELSDKVRANFDANFDINKQQDNIEILITTETLAEGVNLHRANSIVNYDTPWNATRLMQRIGRVNRIGSTSDNVYIYNFYPTEQVESDIKLKSKADIKLQAFHSALGEDSQIYSDDEQVDTFSLFDQTIQGDETVNERLLYLEELRKFKKQHPNQFKVIKNLPLRIRNAVAIKYEQDRNSTVCFLRNNQHNSFYWVTPQTATKISFLEAITYFERHNLLDSKQLPDTHYQQVNKSIEEFESEQTDKVVSETNAKLSPQQRRAIIYLQSLVHIGNETECELLNNAIEWIDVGKYQNLPRDLNKCYKKSSNPKAPLAVAIQLEQVIKILKHYQQSISKETKDDSDTVKTVGKPKIVISQSYI